MHSMIDDSVVNSRIGGKTIALFECADLSLVDNAW